MQIDAKIYVAWNWLVWRAIQHMLAQMWYNNIITRTHKELDLTDAHAVEQFFLSEIPEYIFLAAAKVWGIMANNTYPVDFIYDNLQIQNNVIHSAYKYWVKKLLFLWSSCIYPKLALQPIKEEYLLTWLLEPTNEPYAIAKIAWIKMCQSYNRQYKTEFIACMPTNLYGPFDNFDIQSSHVLPAMIRKFHEAKTMQLPSVTLWWDWTPMREFLYVEDMATACIFLMNSYTPTDDDNQHGSIYVNIGTGQDVTIKELATTIKHIVWYEWDINRDTSKPNWTPRKLLDVSKINTLWWTATTSLEDWIKKTYSWFLEHKATYDN